MTVLWPVAHSQTYVTTGPVDNSNLTCDTLSNNTSCDSWACRWHLYDLWHTIKQNITWPLGLSMSVILNCDTMSSKHHLTVGPGDVSYLTCGTLSNKISWDSWACRWQRYDLRHNVKRNTMRQLSLSITVIWPVAHCQAKHHVTVGPVGDSYLAYHVTATKLWQW